MNICTWSWYFLSVFAFLTRHFIRFLRILCYMVYGVHTVCAQLLLEFLRLVHAWHLLLFNWVVWMKLMVFGLCPKRGITNPRVYLFLWINFVHHLFKVTITNIWFVWVKFTAKSALLWSCWAGQLTYSHFSWAEVPSRLGQICFSGEL